ncbi:MULTISPECIES: hypothetical protein [Reichenbachiella]|uniref:DUF4834 domain-containing protein n=1 Tax=Reichenbachiella agariperforans TaxID=156994 RepID=A0A1M6THK4_REIAG|nr:MULTISPECIES: hypothetical protein [Reichenbachiella]MBU2915440.1 DUF4834 domain-containing protein [Reichenbachiella agariperforans]RJE71490.1 hypothetical protein BGP76_05160 [Reichenbachiella sp. MSK19-1]SHK56403.1 hypothetical protein SAMN04488028_10645 [Reichenbachiella agariperforans]
MLKFLVLFILFFWIVFKLGGFFMRMFLGNMVNQNRQQSAQQHQQRQPQDGNVHIDFVPKKGTKAANKSDFKGGDYVDYEEV